MLEETISKNKATEAWKLCYCVISVFCVLMHKDKSHNDIDSFRKLSLLYTFQICMCYSVCSVVDLFVADN